jgi:hypothetical protein
VSLVQPEQERGAAFVKRLATLATAMAPHQAIATMAMIRHIMQRYPRTTQLLDAEVACDGIYMATVTEPEHCNALAATLWEGVALAQHWHPSVAKHALELLTGKLTLLPNVTLQTLRELVHTLDVAARGTFTPPVRLPSAAQQKRSNGAHALLARTGAFNARQPPRRTPPPAVPLAPSGIDSDDDDDNGDGAKKRNRARDRFLRQFANAKLRAAVGAHGALLARWKKMKHSQRK